MQEGGYMNMDYVDVSRYIKGWVAGARRAQRDAIELLSGTEEKEGDGQGQQRQS